MDDQLAASLTALPRLDPTNAHSATEPCKICGSPAAFFDVTDFWKGSSFYSFGPSGITVRYYRCDACGFMFTPLCDDWSFEDFKKYIYNDDYILVDGEYLTIRPMRTAAYMAKWLHGFEDARILDYGSGTGLFADRMREAGFRRIASYDPFSEPSRPTGRFDIVTCFEVIEHSPVPIEIIQEIASFLNEDACVVFGESLQPPDIAATRCNWWYCMPRNGHVSLYTDTALAIAGARVGLSFHKGNGMHVFSRPGVGRFASIGDRIGPPLVFVSLGAPREGRTSLWHGLERFSGTPTRWTATPELSWRVAVPAGRVALLRIRIPFASEIKPGFSAESRILVDGEEATTQVVDRSIIAEVATGTSPSVEVMLRTPELLSPSDLRNSSDRRRLGLAIHCE